MSGRRSARSRSRSRSPQRGPYGGSRDGGRQSHRSGPGRGGDGYHQSQSRREQRTQLNKLQEEQRMREWVAQEDDFVLRQAKKKAEIRVKEGRARPIDWLTVTLRVVDPTTRNLLDDEVEDADLDIIDPEGVLEQLTSQQLDDLEKDIDMFLSLEKTPGNLDFWRTMKIICMDRKKKMRAAAPENRVIRSVAADIDKLLSPKSYEELCTLEGQIRRKLGSDEPIDTDYWEQLLQSLIIWKARAKAKRIYESVVQERVAKLRAQQREEAVVIQSKLAPLAPVIVPGVDYSRNSDVKVAIDVEPSLQLRPLDKGLEVVDEEVFLRKIALERLRIRKQQFVPLWQHANERTALSALGNMASAPALAGLDDFSLATKALYERELARGVSENEEIFTAEENIATEAAPAWANKYRPRKPRYFNRVQMGYEWNKYNQTHYDYDNPPPRVVMGYKFNIFYPDLIDKTRAPTYKIIRENGRKRGQSFAPAGEEDTCLIRFIAGPPYEDIAFRIVDKEWDYSAKRERGFRSSFDKGILQLHFQFKKIYYRK
ncbi:hypothetical protein KEM52_001444 [Ascosphaera acerosa]|nr:hypothetical protein KEM52_001444 [Ascosphaera acerosa]